MKKPAMPSTGLLTVYDMARFVGCSQRSIWRFVAQGRLDPPIAVGGSARIKRWPTAALAAFLPGLDLNTLPTRTEK